MRRIHLPALRRCKYRPVAGAALIVAMVSMLFPGTALSLEERRIIDMAGRTATIPQFVDRAICSGAGCLRLLTYLSTHDRIVAVDSIELRGSPIDARPYAIANPQFKTYPLFGEFRGHDNPELIAGLQPQPQVIFKTIAGRGQDPDHLRTDSAYQGLSAVRKGDVFGLFPYNSYNQNFEAVFANAYYAGKVLYPDRFADVEPMAKAEEISILLNGGPAFETLNKQFEDLAFSRIRVE